jgi:hypothetical protein
MPPGLKRTLDKAGLTQADYEILSTNPFTSGSRLDSNRFLPTTQSFPYLPPISPNDTPPTFTYTLQNSLARTATKTAQTQYSVGFNVTVGFEGIFSASLKTSKTMEWTNLSSNVKQQIVHPIGDRCRRRSVVQLRRANRRAGVLGHCFQLIRLQVSRSGHVPCRAVDRPRRRADRLRAGDIESGGS